jgi:hypothetical protein
MTISAASGSRLFIGTTTSAENLSQFLSDSYQEVGEVEDLGEFGDESEAVTFASLQDSRVRKLKGTRDAGTIAVVCGADDTDAGQDDMVAAEASSLDFNFKILLNDQLTLGGTPSEHYFRGKVMSKRLGVGSANNVVRRTFNVGINSEILEIPAT